VNDSTGIAAVKRVLIALGPPLLVFRGPDGRSLPLPGAPPLTGRLMFGLFGAFIAGVMSLLNTRLTTFGVADQAVFCSKLCAGGEVAEYRGLSGAVCSPRSPAISRW
jgi:hypothetical protein